MQGGEPVRLLNLGPTRWVRTQSVYRATAELLDSDAPDVIVMSTPLHGYLAVGGGQNPQAALDLALCARLNLPVISSPLGAPVSYLGPGALVSQWVFCRRDPDDLARRMLEGFVRALQALGIGEAAEEGSRIAIGGRTLVQVQTGAIGPAAVVQGDLFLLPDAQADMVAGIAPRASLWQAADGPLSPDRVEGELLRSFAEVLGRAIKRGTPRQEETRLSKKIDLELLAQAAELTGSEVVLDAEL